MRGFFSSLRMTILSLYTTDQFSAECSPPEPARNSMLVFSPKGEWAQFHKHAPQCTHFSRSKAIVPSAP